MGALDNLARTLLKGKVGGPHAGGISVYHSSPHDFDRFDWSKIGSGEGGAMFGKGFYFAENPQISGQGGSYWGQFLDRFPPREIEAAQSLQAHGFDRAKAIDDLRYLMATKEDYLARGSSRRVSEGLAQDRKMLELFESGKPIGPRTYEVNINARPELFLDWDKPLSQQPKELQQWVQRNPTMLRGQHPAEPTGKSIYRRFGDDVQASQTLRNEVGIPGIRYLDQGSRNVPPLGPDAQRLIDETGSRSAALDAARLRMKQAAWNDVDKIGGSMPGLLSDETANWQNVAKQLAKDRTYNYVVTDPSLLTITGKYALPGAATAGMGALAAQDQYGEVRQ